MLNTLSTVAVTIMCVTAIVATFQASRARRAYHNAKKLFQDGLMNVQDLAAHITPLIASANTVIADNANLLQQIKADNEANGADNTTVDAAIANIDTAKAALDAAHAATLAAAAPPATSDASVAAVGADGSTQVDASIGVAGALDGTTGG